MTKEETEPMIMSHKDFVIWLWGYVKDREDVVHATVYAQLHMQYAQIVKERFLEQINDERLKKERESNAQRTQTSGPWITSGVSTQVPLGIGVSMPAPFNIGTGAIDGQKLASIITTTNS